MEDEAFHQLLKHLPGTFGLIPARYTNGAFTDTYSSDVKTSNPQFNEHNYQIAMDDADYLARENGGCSHPGCILGGRGEVIDSEVEGACTTNAELLVQRGEHKRLTVAAHGWEAEKTSTVYHGRKIVGYITRVLVKDIVILDPGVPVCNDFSGANCIAKDLMSCRDIDIGDICCVDSCYTGSQRLGFAGTRYRKRRPRKHQPL